MTDTEYFDQLREIIAMWLNSREKRDLDVNVENFPFIYGKHWEEEVENSRRKTGLSREDFLNHLRILMLFK